MPQVDSRSATLRLGISPKTLHPSRWAPLKRRPCESSLLIFWRPVQPRGTVPLANPRLSTQVLDWPPGLASADPGGLVLCGSIVQREDTCLASRGLGFDSP